MLKTTKDYTLSFRHYGTITVPAGTVVTHQTAIGYDENYNFVDEFSWVDANYPDFANILKMDIKNYGINIPAGIVTDGFQHPLITFEEESKEVIANYIKGRKTMLVLVDNDSNNVCAILNGKTFLDKLPTAIGEEIAVDDMQIDNIHLTFIKHNYSIECKCKTIEDGEEQEREYTITTALVY